MHPTPRGRTGARRSGAAPPSPRIDLGGRGRRRRLSTGACARAAPRNIHEGGGALHASAPGPHPGALLRNKAEGAEDLHLPSASDQGLFLDVWEVFFFGGFMVVGCFFFDEVFFGVIVIMVILGGCLEM